MALTPTIYKCTIALSDLDHQVYETLNLTVAKHPSETNERMMVRVIAYCIHAHRIDSGHRLDFGRGLSETDDPDLWVRSLDDRIAVWIDVGEPSADRIKKASRAAARAVVYSFNSKSKIWWEQTRDKCEGIAINIIQFQWQDVVALARFVERKMELGVSISGESVYVSSPDDQCELIWTRLHGEAEDAHL